jgi:hypothetical protein
MRQVKQKGVGDLLRQNANRKKILAKFLDFGKIFYFWLMVSVAQLVRALGCGPRGRGFEPLHSPQIFYYLGWNTAR